METVLEKIEKMILPVLEEEGFELIRLTYIGNHTLQIMIEHQDGRNPTVGECQKISREVSTLMDVEDFISSAYMLEVSSPGIDRPLTRLKDFEKAVGFEAKIELSIAVNDQKKFRGEIQNVEGEEITIIDSAREISFPFANVKEAKLVLTDKLLKAKKPKQENLDEDKTETDNKNLNVN